eukprot:s601_g13.t1
MEQPVAEDGWQLVAGDDDVPERNPRLRERHLVWQQMVAARSTRSFQDAEFPAGPRAVDGRREDRVGTDVFRATLSEVSHRAGVSEEGVLCRCGQPAQLRRVQRKGPTFGRPYYACPLRSCRFFEFADQASTVAALELQWKRFPAFGDWCVVRDEGFRPADVQQGGVGDCWFMSALAVVAERHDLMSKLLPNLNIGAESGCHEVRLFMDGRWTSLLVDDHLPTTTKQRRPTADGSGLAFGRCARRQLWALLELTGAPTEAALVNFGAQAGCPIGCGTGAETLEELGLVGQHAYSVLETDEALQVASQAGGYGFALLERRVKVRNPWGEWTRREQDELLAQLGAAVVPDEGSFWMSLGFMNYGDFIRGFAVADICYARDGWHARSFDAEFGGSVGCRSALQLRGSGECWVMAVQPTERGKQIKKPPGYYLNDLSLLIFQETQDDPKLVTAAIGGARRDVVSSVVLEAGKTYTVVPLSFRGSSSRGSFVLRLYSASPVQVREEPPSPERTWAAFHRLLLSPEPPPRTLRRAQDFGVGRLVVLEGPAMAVGLFVNFGPVGFLAELKAFGNHAALRTLQGIQEGTRHEHRNQEDAKRQASSSEKKKAKADWRQHHLQVQVPGFAGLLAFVAVALLENWEFSLESLEAEQQLEDSMEKPPPSTHPFAPVFLEKRLGDWDGSDGSEGLRELEDLELQAALRESARLAAEAQAMQAQPGQSDGDSDPELQLALSMSLVEDQAVTEAPKPEKASDGGSCPAPAPAEDPPRRPGRWMRRSRQT